MTVLLHQSMGCRNPGIVGKEKPRDRGILVYGVEGTRALSENLAKSGVL